MYAKADLPCDQGAIYSYAKIVMEATLANKRIGVMLLMHVAKCIKKKTLPPIVSFSGLQKVRKIY
jgi:hypothetical protein